MIQFIERSEGITIASVANAAAKAEISLYGAHVLSYAPKGQKDLLFLSEKSLFTSGKPIRGGIPVCFPWFGPNADDPALPMHGFARLKRWTLLSMEESQDRSTLVLELRDDPETMKVWPWKFRATLGISVGARLDMVLTIENAGQKPFIVSDALHSYFNVKSIQSVSIQGLEGLAYIDRVGGRAIRKQEGPVRVSSETDRVYLKPKAVTIIDPGFKREILIEKKSFSDVVVWNPWIDKAKAMADFGDEEYERMICVEAASVFENAVSIDPGTTLVQKMAIACSTRP